MNVKLGAEITSGGEGIIYEVHGQPQLVAKMFKRPNENQHIKLMMPHLGKLPNAFVIPKDFIGASQIEGFVMDKVGKQYHPISFIKYDKSGVTTPQKIELFKLIRNGIESAHGIGIQLGDINGENLMYHKDIKFLDTTAYQTPYKKLTHYYLQPEITDFLFNHLGITNETDFFAFAALTYELLTGCHPFKGNHPNFSKGGINDKLKERQIAKVSVLGSHSGLIVPKSHKAINEKWLFDQYFSIFEKGDRFLVKFDKTVTLQKNLPQVDMGDVQMKTIFSGVIDKFEFNDNVVIINRNSYSIEGKGWYRMDKSNTDMDYYCGGKYYHINTRGEVYINGVVNKNLNLWNTTNHFSNGTLFALGGDTMYRVDLRDLSYSSDKAFEASYGIGHGVRQYLGGKSHLQVVLGGKLNTISVPYNVLDFYQFGDFLSVKYKEGQAIKYGYMRAEGGAKILKETDDLRFSCYRDDGYIFEPQDGEIKILRKEDFEPLGGLKCSKVQSDSHLFISKGGIVLKNEDEVVLINKN